MYLYRCSKCRKEVVPKLFKRMSIETFGVDVHKKSRRFCKCKNPDVTKSKEEYDKAMKVIAETITESFRTKPQMEKVRI